MALSELLPIQPGNWAHINDFLAVSHAPDGTLLGSFPFSPTAVKTTGYSAVVGDLVPVDTTAGAVTVTLPTAPANKSCIAVKLAVQGVPTGGATGGLANNVTVAAGGSDVFNVAAGATTVTIARANQAIVFEYDSAHAIWYAHGDAVPSVVNTLSSTTYGTAVSIGNVSGSFTGSGLGSPADIWAPLVIYAKFNATNLGANVTKTTQAFFAAASYYGPTSDDSAECGNAAVQIKDTGTPFTQTRIVTGFEGSAQIEGGNTVSGSIRGIAGRLRFLNTSVSTEGIGVYSTFDKDAGASVTTYYAFKQSATGPGTTNYGLYALDQIYTASTLQGDGGLAGDATYAADLAPHFGLKTWNGDPTQFSTSQAPTAGTIYAVAVQYRKGQTISKTLWFSNVAGSGTAPTHIFTGICDATGKMLAQSNDDAANSGWTGGNHFVSSALSGNWTVPSTGLYYHVFLQVGAWSVTQLTLNRAGGPPNYPNGSFAQGTGSTTGQAALPANNSTLVGGLVTGGFRFWGGS